MSIALYNPRLNQYYNPDDDKYTSSLLIKRGNVYYPNTKIYDSKEDAMTAKQQIDNSELVIVTLQLKLINDE